MTHKRSIHAEPELFKVQKSRLIFGLAAGLIFAFCFYALMYLTRESFRFVSLTENYDLWILTDKEVSFYNFIFAFISVIFGQSICFVFWFEKPLNLYSRKRFQYKAIVNDQKYLNSIFLFWFSEMAIIYGLSFGVTYQSGFYTFGFYPKYNYFFVLIILVLFFQTWNSIRKINKKNSMKWMLISLLMVSSIAYGLSKVNLIDYKSINSIALQKNIPLKYNLEVPESNCDESKFENRSMKQVIYVVRNKQKMYSTPQIFIDNVEVTINNLGSKILEFQSNKNESDIAMCIYHLYIDKTINMKFISELKNEMVKANALKIAFAFVPPNPEYDKRYYNNYSIRIRLPKYDSENYNLIDTYKKLNEFENIIEVRNTDFGELIINGKTYWDDTIKQVIKESIKRNPNYIIKFHINYNVDFSVYFKLISKTKEAVDELRNEYSLLTFSKEFDDLNDGEMNETVNKYGFRIFDMTNELRKVLDGGNHTSY